MACAGAFTDWPVGVASVLDPSSYNTTNESQKRWSLSSRDVHVHVFVVCPMTVECDGVEILYYVSYISHPWALDI